MQKNCRLRGQLFQKQSLIDVWVLGVLWPIQDDKVNPVNRISEDTWEQQAGEETHSEIENDRPILVLVIRSCVPEMKKHRGLESDRDLHMVV